MPIFKLSAPETVHLLNGHILPRSESNFTHNNLDFRKKFPERNRRTLAYRGREGKGKGLEGIEGFIPLEEASADGKDRGGAIGRAKEGEGPAAGGILLQGLKGG